MKKLFKLAAAAAIATTLVACGNSGSNQNTLTIGISPDYKPYEYLDKDNNMQGFDIEMVDLFQKYLDEEGQDITLEFKQMDFDNIITQIQGDQVDLGISGFTYSEDRKVEWSNPYLGTSQVAILPADSEITSVEELKGKSIAAQTGATAEQAANDIEDAKVTGLKNVQDIMNALSAHQYDAAVVDLGVAKNYVANGEFKMLEESLLDEKNYIIAKEGNTEVMEKMNKCIEKFLASEDYAKLCEKYDLAPLEVE